MNWFHTWFGTWFGPWFGDTVAPSAPSTVFLTGRIEEEDVVCGELISFERATGRLEE